MNEFPASGDLYFLLDRSGAVVAYRENVAPWAAVVAFSSEDGASRFRRESGCEAEIVAVAHGDEASLRSMINQMKNRGIRYLLLDLDYRRGNCTRYEFEGDWLGESRPHQFRPPHH